MPKDVDEDDILNMQPPTLTMKTSLDTELLKNTEDQEDKESDNGSTSSN